MFDLEDNKVKDHCHIIGKYRRSTHWGCNISFRLTKKFSVIFNNLWRFESHLMISKKGKFVIKAKVTRNELKKFMDFTIKCNLRF